MITLISIARLSSNLRSGTPPFSTRPPMHVVVDLRRAALRHCRKRGWNVRKLDVASLVRNSWDNSNCRNSLLHFTAATIKRILTGDPRTRFPAGKTTGRGLKPINWEARNVNWIRERQISSSFLRWRLNGDTASAIPTFRSHLRAASKLYLEFNHWNTRQSEGGRYSFNLDEFTSFRCLFTSLSFYQSVFLKCQRRSCIFIQPKTISERFLVSYSRMLNRSSGSSTLQYLFFI